jgi:hypothetical protein
MSTLVAAVDKAASTPAPQRPPSALHVHRSAGARHGSLRDEWSYPPPQCAEDLNLSIVVLGASGDLAKKKTFPALLALHSKGCVHVQQVGHEMM